ncbi:MAG: hypothetical protein EU549_02435 [Promethearchaeota archaeon]|nr:MAG: hypothetical protein EU549_02435 [Candidatus Lokiarchaeota archaeon]
MVKFYSIIEDFFLSEYDDYPLEIKKKMKNLFFIDILNILGWIAISSATALSNQIGPADIITIIRDHLVLGFIILSFILIKLKKPLLAGYASLSMVLAFAVHSILMDLLGITYFYELLLYRTLCYLIIGELIISAYTIKRIQIIIFSLNSYLILLLHFWILTEKVYGGIVTLTSYAMIFEALFLLTAGCILSLFLFNLTLESRVEVIDNIIFYKMTLKGPVPIFLEHDADYGVILESGVYFYTAIGQGIRYRTGLFGPLPFGEKSETVSLIYSEIVKDSGFEESRMEGMNYIMIVFLGNEKQVELIERHKFIEKIKTSVKNIPDLANFNEDDFQNFINSIRAR